MIKKETYLTCPNSNIFEGITSISAILNKFEQNVNRSTRTVVRVLVDEKKAHSKAREVSYLQKMAKKHGFSVCFVNSEQIDALTTGTTHGGIIAECAPKEIPLLINHMDEIRPDGVYVMLDGIEDPYNFGYSVRSIYASGADGIILSPRNWMEVAGIVSKSSAGASELMDMYIADPADAIRLFREHGYKIVCSGIRNSVSMYDADLKKPLFLIVGGEKRGISAKIESEADSVVRIEYGREFRGSLSAASAATIMVYEIYRQNR